MVALLNSVLNTIPASLPLIKISNWTVKVKQERKIGFSKDRDIIEDFKQNIKWGQEQIAGFFQNTEPGLLDIAEFDSFISLNGQHNSQVVRNAVENGAFRSVNKIKDPNKIIIELAKGGYRAGIEEVLTNLKKYQNSTAVCTVITPFGQLDNLNLVGLDYSFTIDNGSNLLIAKLTFQEIRYGSKIKEKKKKIPGTEKLKDGGRKAVQTATGILKG